MRCRGLVVGLIRTSAGYCSLLNRILERVVFPRSVYAQRHPRRRVNALWKSHEATVRQHFAPELVAKQEIFGYLLNDMAGKQLLHKDYAMPVGQRGDNAVTKAKSQLKLKSAAACLALDHACAEKLATCSPRQQCLARPLELA